MALAATMVTPMMGIIHVVTMTFVVSSVRSMPSRRPLTSYERLNPGSTSWMLLVSDQDFSGEQEDIVTAALTSRRRITPKSVFIAPTFSPCADGYHSDAMGRCIKTIIDLDEAAHLNFLLQKLNAQFADYVIEDDDVEVIVEQEQLEESPLNNKIKKVEKKQQPSSSSAESLGSHFQSGPFLINIPLDITTQTNHDRQIQQNSSNTTSSPIANEDMNTINVSDVDSVTSTDDIHPADESTANSETTTSVMNGITSLPSSDARNSWQIIYSTMSTTESSTMPESFTDDSYNEQHSSITTSIASTAMALDEIVSTLFTTNENEITDLNSSTDVPSSTVYETHVVSTLGSSPSTPLNNTDEFSATVDNSPSSIIETNDSLSTSTVSTPFENITTLDSSTTSS